jgi:ABC-type transport system involved in multi-copper enzyme maturation permease subunit
VVWAIARREIGIAARRRIVQALFFFSVGPPLVFAIFLVIRLLAREAVGVDLGWDPVAYFLRFQAGVVGLLALGLGTPSVSRDRSEEVLYLYAVRPVTPWDYALGKITAVVLPAFLLIWVPALLITVLRAGILGDMVPVGETLLFMVKATAAAVVLSLAYAGISVGPSALFRQGRWAFLVAFGLLFMIPEPIRIIRGDDFPALGPTVAAADLFNALFGDQTWWLGLTGAAALLLYGFLGTWITRSRVQREMIP